MEKQDNKYAELWQYIEKHRSSIEDGLREYTPIAPTHIETQFNEAVEYALFQGDNRYRSILTLLGSELVDGKSVDVLPAGVAVEFIYTSSIIFDDLLDQNSSKKRGKETLDAKFGEGLATLVGLGFLNSAYPLVFVNHSGMPERAMQAHSEIVECVGASGLIGGQPIDSALVKSVGGVVAQKTESESIRKLQTSSLMRLALRLGAILSGANYLELASLSRFGELVGDAYQLRDESIDLQKEEDIFLINEAEESLNLKLSTTIDEAKRILIENFPSNEARSCLIQLTEYLAERKV